MKKSSGISKEDSALFREAVGNIKPLTQDRVVQNRPKPNFSITRKENEPSDTPLFSDTDSDQKLLERGDELSFSRPEVQKPTLRKLRRGQFKIENELDLHGLTADMAKVALSEFLEECHQRSQRCVCVIHGKGIGSENQYPIIKNKVNHWLRQSNNVLAFCSAQVADGGTGAIYLLLKQH